MRGALALCTLAACGRVGFDPPIDAVPEPLSITTLTLVDPVTKLPLKNIINGGTFEIIHQVGGITVLADADGAASIEFVRNGESIVENSAPYLSGGDFGADYYPDPMLAIGDNELAVTASAADGAKGPTKTIALTLTYDVSSPVEVVRAGITDANGGGFIELVDGGAYGAAMLPMMADVHIETSPEIVGSVVIGGSGPWTAHVENYKPYTAMTTGTAFTPTPGTYTLTARAFTLGGGGGLGGAEYSVTFTIVP